MNPTRTCALPALSKAAACFLFLTVLLFGRVDVIHAEISKGHRILIERGLQVQGLCIDDNFVTLSTYTNANYTSFCWLNEYSVDTNGQVQATHSSRPEWMGPAPGVLPWTRWVRHETLLPPHIPPYGEDETPYMSQLMALQLGDEWHLNDDAVRNQLVNWFVAERANWPNTILYHNSWGSQVGDAQLADFYTRAQPDMLSFDTYPWRSVWDVNEPDHIGAPIAGPPVGWYGDLRRYREHGRAAGIPVGIYRQTFHSVQDYDYTVYRDPSLSELRLNTFAALAFNVKYFMDYTYNTGANSMFERQCNWCGDTAIKPNGLYAELSDVNLRAQKLGKALVRLTPITNERIPGYTTSMMFIRGKDGNGTFNPIPVGFLTTDSEAHSSWLEGYNDPYLKSWSVANTGSVNNGQPGDVIVSWFKPLDESFDGDDHSNEIYMMVVNGLTHTNGTAADCSQEITLNFESSLAAVEMLNPLTGVAELQMLPLMGEVRQLVLNLNGGDAVLFKFASGAPFVGAQTAPVSGAPVITIHPRSRENVAGTHATFSVSAVGSTPLSYQWQWNGADLPGRTTSELTFLNVQLSNTGTYSVVVSNSFGVVTSMPAELTVVSGAPLLYEPFDYSNIGSPVSSNTPANWAHNTGTATNDTQVASGNLSYPGLAPSVGNSITNGGVGLGARRLFGTNVSSGELYFSALFRINEIGNLWNGLSSQVGAFTAPDNTSFRLAVHVMKTSSTTYVIGLRKGGAGATDIFDTTERAEGETVFLVGRYDFETSPDTVTLWINPGLTLDSLSGSVISTNTGADGFAIDRFNFRQNTAASVPAAMQWDELRVGTRWDDVAAPRPVTLNDVLLLEDGKIRFSHSGGSAQNGSVFVSSDLLNWTLVGKPTEITTGTYEVTDTKATNHLKRFYQLRWP